MVDSSADPVIPIPDEANAASMTATSEPEKHHTESKANHSSEASHSHDIPKALAPVTSTVATLPSNADRFLTRLQKCLATPQGTDSLLLLVCYSTKFLSSALASASIRALEHRARQIVALALSIPPTNASAAPSKATPVANARTIDVLLAPANVTGLPSTLMALSARLGALSSLISDMRAFTRLWALLGLYFWAKKLLTARSAQHSAITLREKDASASAKNSSGHELVENNTDLSANNHHKSVASMQTALDVAVTYGSLGSAIALQLLENVAYLGSKKVLPVAPVTQARLFQWSSRFWALYVALDVGRLLREYAARSRSTMARRVAATKRGELTAWQRDESEWQADWKRSLLKQMAWIPITVHHSRDEPMLSEGAIGLLGMVPGVIQVADLWMSS